MSFHITKAGSIQRPDISKIVSCRFRGKYVECTAVECAGDGCKKCGWNPIVEADRIQKVMGK